MSGSLKYRVQGLAAELEARAGQLIVLPAGVTHELVRTSEDVALWVMELNGNPPLDWLSRPQVLAPGAGWRKSLITDTRRLWLRPPLQETFELQQRLFTTLSSFKNVPHAPRPPDLHPAVKRAKNLCERQVHEELDATTIARVSGLSASRLAHLFSEQLGISPLQYRNFAQVQRFIQAYNDDERNLLRAALAAGFGSYAQFHRVFRQVCGEHPSAHFRWLSESGEVDARRTLIGTVSQLSGVA